MKLMRFFVLLGAACIMGCGSADTGAEGDANDPETSGTDAEQMDDESGEMGDDVEE